MTTQLAAFDRLLLAMSLMTLSLIAIVPPFPRILSMTPSQNSRPASVTTNDGRPIRVMIKP